MNKKEFLDVMERRLSVLEPRERKYCLSDYHNNNEFKIKTGISQMQDS